MIYQINVIKNTGSCYRYSFLLLLFFLSLSVNAEPRYSFFLEKDYRSSFHLFSTLSDEGLTSVNHFFLWCCDCIMYYARSFGVSYAFLNILLFVLLQPLLILIFMGLWLYERKRGRLQRIK
jgi:hypothetical protein